MNAAEARADEAEDRLRSAVEARKQSESEHDAHASVSMMKVHLAQLGELSRQHGDLQASVQTDRDRISNLVAETKFLHVALDEVMDTAAFKMKEPLDRLIFTKSDLDNLPPLLKILAECERMPSKHRLEKLAESGWSTRHLHKLYNESIQTRDEVRS